jgi:hypothetical protein
LTNNALQECHHGKLIQHSNLTKHLKDDKDKNCNRSNNAEIKTTTVKDRNKMQQKFNPESINL